MAMIKCKECGQDVSSKVKKCPHCGFDSRSWFRRHKVITFFGSLISLIFILSIAASMGSNNSTDTKASSNSLPVEKTSVKEKPNTVDEKKNEAVSESKEPVWNTKELDAMKNGNIQVAAKLIQSKPDLKTSAVQVEPAKVAKTPWNYYGKPIRVAGDVAVLQDFPPDSEITKGLGGKDSSDIVVSCEDGTTVEVFCGISSGSLKVGDKINLFGYPVGVTEVDNKLGGKNTHLILIGNSFEKVTE